MTARYLLILAAILSLAACAKLSPIDFAAERPQFEPEKFFAGHVRSWGVIETRSGDPSRRFTTDIQGHSDGAVLVLDQHFAFADGRQEQRVWRLRRLDEHHYEGTAGDVVGKAAGEAYGNVFRWEYALALSPGNPLKNVHMRQWMYGVGDGSEMVNRVEMTKFGVTVAQVTEFFVRDRAQQ